MNKQLSVRLYGEPVGVLTQLSNGKMKFSYLPDATQAISISMPLTEHAYPASCCEAFFGGLLPESEQVRKIIGKRYGVSYNNSFALLKAIGYDCAGAISLHEIGDPIISQKSFPLRGKIITKKALYEHIFALPRDPLFLGFEGLRLSLAGVQDKAAVCLIDNQIALPQAGCPTTFILKPAITGFEGIVENEYFCLKLAKRMGLPVPHVEIRQIKDISFLLIARYDRRITHDQVERIHQEDFCQALGIISGKKYQNEGGPGFKACFNLLTQTTYPVIDRNTLASIMVFNFLIGNTDAHGKNFSILYQDKSTSKLAPFYDLLSTQVYPDITKKMAMKIGSKYHANEVFQRHWQQLCTELDYSYPALKRLMKEQSEKILTAANLEKNEIPQMKCNIPIIDLIIDKIEKNILQLS